MRWRTSQQSIIPCLWSDAEVSDVFIANWHLLNVCNECTRRRHGFFFFFFFLRVFMYCVFTRMPGESYRRRFRSLMCSCDVFRALINSLCLFLDGFWLMLVSRGWVINLDTCFVITCWTCLIFVIDTVQELTMFSGMKDSVFLNCESDLWFDELSFVQVKIAWLSGK